MNDVNTKYILLATISKLACSRFVKQIPGNSFILPTMADLKLRIMYTENFAEQKR